MADIDRDDEQLLRQTLAGVGDTRAAELGPGVLARVGDVFRACFGESPAALVADSNTWDAAGRRTAEILRDQGVAMVGPEVFEPAALCAEYHHVDRLTAAFARHEAVPVAVGAGTINDLVKLASHLTGRRYMSIATAASMDGYTAFGASIMRDGIKQTFTCPAPRAVIADTDVLCRAPVELSAAGYGDLAAKLTAGADWIVADALGVEPIRQPAWSLVQDRLRDWIADPGAVRRGDPRATGKLTLGLLMTGFAMQSAKSSRPASGAEHQFSHLWDMQGHSLNGRVPYHGHKVGVSAIMTTRLYEHLLAHELDRLPVERLCAEWPSLDDYLRRAEESHGATHLRCIAAEEIRAKYIDRETLAGRLERLRACWPDLRQRLHRQLVPSPRLSRMFEEAGLPSTPAAVGISAVRLRRTFFEAQQIRRRYTVLDLAVETSLLRPIVDALFQSTAMRDLIEPRRG